MCSVCMCVCAEEGRSRSIHAFRCERARCERAVPLRHSAQPGADMSVAVYMNLNVFVCLSMRLLRASSMRRLWLIKMYLRVVRALWRERTSAPGAVIELMPRSKGERQC